MIREVRSKAVVVAMTLVVAVLAVCLIEAAGVSASTHHGCAVATASEPASASLSLAKIASSLGWVIPAQGALPCAGWRASSTALQDDHRAVLPAGLDSQISPRSPPVSL